MSFNFYTFQVYPNFIFLEIVSNTMMSPNIFLLYNGKNERSFRRREHIDEQLKYVCAYLFVFSILHH